MPKRFRHIIAGFAGLILALPLGVQAIPDDASETITKLFEDVSGGTVAERVATFSEHFRGAEYEDGPLGEGPRGKYDTNPTFRTDRFDCTTFVETVMALSLAKNLAGFQSILNRIRYRDGKVSFVNRNHFPCADWIPHNVAAGFVADITKEVAGEIEVAYANAQINKRGWYAALPASRLRVPDLSPGETEKRLAALRAEGRKFATQSVSLPYIPLEKIVTRHPVSSEEKQRRAQEEESLLTAQREAALKLPPPERSKFEIQAHAQLVDQRTQYLARDAEFHSDVLERIPSGSILNIVRPNMAIPGTHLNISHQGLVIKLGGKNYFRHPSRTGGERVKDVLLANYIRLCLLSPPIKGVNVLRIESGPTQNDQLSARRPSQRHPK